jgi:hypothetical protein
MSKPAMSKPVFHPDEVTPQWLGTVLHNAGAATGQLTGISAEHIGAGKVGDNVRFSLQWTPAGSGPTSVVGKFPSPDPMSRAAGVSLGNYEREVRFYSELVATVEVNAPRCHLAALHTDTGDFVLVMDDLDPAVVGDQITGCHPDDAAAAIVELVGLHAPRWDDHTLGAYGQWLGPRLVHGGEPIAAIYHGLVPGFIERYGDRLSTTAMKVAEAFDAVVDRWVEPDDSPLTLTHNDFRLDNLLFTDHRTSGGRRAAVVDWQTVGLGPGVADVSYLVGSGLLTDNRQAHERDLLADYTARMRARGVPLDDNTAWHDYRRTCAAGLVMSVFASSVVGPGERSDEMFLAMAERHAAQMEDLDVIAELAASGPTRGRDTP